MPRAGFLGLWRICDRCRVGRAELLESDGLMHRTPVLCVLSLGLAAAAVAAPASGAQEPVPPQPPQGFPGEPGGFPGGGPGGPGGPVNREPVKVLAQFDADRNGWLDAAERTEARAWLAQNRPRGRGMRGAPPGGAGEPPRGGAPQPGGAPPMGRGGRGPGGPVERGSEGPEVAPESVPVHPDRDLYDPSVVKTYFFVFESADWEQELSDFHDTDVEVPARLTVDGTTIARVGVRFRGNSSYQGIPAGSKKSINLSVDAFDPKADLQGHSTVNLLNCHSDPSFLREVVHGHVANQFFPAPRAALAHVVVNGRSWGVFAASEQVNKDFTDAHFGTRKGARWKVPANFSGGSALAFQGDEIEPYRRLYEAKGTVEDAHWWRLVELCRQLAESDDERLVRDLPEILDIDGALWFLALDNALLDGDGYFSRGSDYGLYLDPTGVFHLVPHDSNEILGAGEGPGGGGPGGPGGGRGGMRGPGGPGGRVSPDQGVLTGADDPRKPLVRRLLGIPQWRARYAWYMRQLALHGLDWSRLAPFVQSVHELADPLVKADTRKLYPYEAFARSVQPLQQLVERRQKALLADPVLAGPWPGVECTSATESRDGDRHRLKVTATTPAPRASATLFVQVKQPGPWEPVAMVRGADGTFEAVTAACEAGERIRYYVSLAVEGAGIAIDPPAGPAKAHEHRFGGAKR